MPFSKRLALPLLIFCLATPAMSETNQPIQYNLSFPDARHHYVEVEARFPTNGQDTLDLAMATWTPGSYLIREYARHVEELSASTPDGDPLSIEKVTKSRWRISSEETATVHVRYRVYGREMTVRTNFVDSSFAMLNGAPTFLTTVDALEGAGVAHEVHVIRPDDWSRVISPLETVGDDAHRFRAEDFDELVDSPLYVGNAEVYRFTVDGAEHLLVNEGETGGDRAATVWDGPRSAEDTEAVVREHLRFWQTRPYDRYVFFNLLVETGGGLEHKNSTILMTSRYELSTPEDRLDWLGLVSHEFFHTWNVKRLRPVELGPFEYEDEVYTESLWVVEGVTSYYDDLLVHRAGLSSRKDYLKELASRIERLRDTPGRKVQPLARSSFDAWIKHYRRDENTVNTAISYYNKGALLAFVLDAEIRRRTGGERSLDDVMRAAYDRYSGKRGFTRAEFEALASEVAGHDLTGLFRLGVDTTEELPIDDALQTYGLRYATDSKDDEDDEPSAAWLGTDTEIDDGRLVVTEVPRETPAFEAGITVEDEILALDGYRVPPRELDDRLKAYRPGDEAMLTVARRERLMELPVTFGEKPKDLKIEVDPEATEQQTARLKAWLAGGGPHPSAPSRLQ